MSDHSENTQRVRKVFDSLPRHTKLCVALISLVRHCEGRPSEFWAKLRTICRTICDAYLDDAAVPQSVITELEGYADSTIKLVSSRVADPDAILFIPQLQFVASAVNEPTQWVLFPHLPVKPGSPHRQAYETATEAMDAIESERQGGHANPESAVLRALLERGG